MSDAGDLRAPMQPGPDGTRVVVCPACAAVIAVPPTGGWVPLRCPSCGIEFAAWDGTTPPPAPPPPPPPPAPARRGSRRTTVDVVTAADGSYSAGCPECELRIPLNRERARKTGRVTCPECATAFVTRRAEGEPSHPEPKPRVTTCPVCAVPLPVAGTRPRARVRCASCGIEFTVAGGGAAVFPLPPPPPPPPPLVRESPLGGWDVTCPRCPDRVVHLPVAAGGSITLICQRCRNPFTVDLPRRAPRAPRPPLPPPPPFPMPDPVFDFTDAVRRLATGCVIATIVGVVLLLLMADNAAMPDFIKRLFRRSP